MARFTRPVVGAVLALGLVLAGSALAEIVLLHSRTVLLSGESLNPAIAVAFNPQPDPPGTPAARLDLSDPTKPVYSQTSATGASYSFSLGVNTGSRSTIRFFPPGPCLPPDPRFPPGPCRASIYGLASDGTRFQVVLEISSESGAVDRASWVAFNPQPDPPGFPGTVTINFALATTARSTSASVAMQLINLDSNATLTMY